MSEEEKQAVNAESSGKKTAYAERSGKGRNKKVKKTPEEVGTEVIKQLMDNYREIGKSLANQLNLSTPNQNLTTGTYREQVWMSLFERIVPRKFCLEQGVFIIDSYGLVSNEVDIAIFDEMYTPYIFNYGKIKFIPIEAVAVAIQCKSTDVGGVDEWAKSILRLRTSLSSVVRMYNGLVDNSLNVSHESVKQGLSRRKSQTSTRPILILCSLYEPGVTEALKDKATSFDIILNVDKGGKLTKTIPREEESFHDWYVKLNHHDWDRYGDEKPKFEFIADTKKTVDGTLSVLRIAAESVEQEGETNENVVLSLTFQLNQLLMLINNPIFFPHQAYAELFKKHLTRKEKEERR